MTSPLDQETDNVGVIFEPADSEVLVITFAHMDFDIDRGRFWGQDAIRKAGYAGMGLIGKGNNWFPAADIERLSDYTNQKSRHYRTVVLYGFSMGAYAAIKYSKHLNADCSIALSPQFSIDPADVYGHDQRLMKHFDTELNARMAIAGDDMAGTIYLFYDPYVPPDVWHCEQIIGRAGAGADIRSILVPRIGHETIDVFSSTELLRDLVRFSIDKDMDALKTLTANSRRRAERRIFNLLRARRAQAPLQAQALYAKYGPGLSAYWQQQWQAGG